MTRARQDSRLSAAGVLTPLLTGLLFLTLLPIEGRSEEQPIWTDKPVRIDRGNQSYERVVAKRAISGTRLSVSARVTVFDSASFSENGQIYVLAGAVPVDPRRLCRGEGNRISACGQQARIFLKRLISNRKLDCAEQIRLGSVHSPNCRLNDTDLAQPLVEKGAAWAATPEMAEVQRQAMTDRLGIWTDSDCLAAARCTGTGREKR